MPSDDQQTDLSGWDDSIDDLEPVIDQNEDYLHGRPLLVFSGPSDLPKEENRRWFMLVVTASLLFIMLALITRQLLLALILAGVAWVTYMMNKLPNKELENIITTTGFFADGRFYPWSQINRFWIIKDNGHYVLGLETNRRAFASVMILLGSQNPVEIRELLSQYIPYDEDFRKDSINQLLDGISVWLEKFYDRIGREIGSRRQSKQASLGPEPDVSPIPSDPVNEPTDQDSKI